MIDVLVQLLGTRHTNLITIAYFLSKKHILHLHVNSQRSVVCISPSLSSYCMYVKMKLPCPHHDE